MEFVRRAARSVEDCVGNERVARKEKDKSSSVPTFMNRPILIWLYSEDCLEWLYCITMWNSIQRQNVTKALSLFLSMRQFALETQNRINWWCLTKINTVASSIYEENKRFSGRRGFDRKSQNNRLDLQLLLGYQVGNRFPLYNLENDVKRTRLEWIRQWQEQRLVEILPLDFKCHSFAWYGQYAPVETQESKGPGSHRLPCLS